MLDWLIKMAQHFFTVIIIMMFQLGTKIAVSGDLCDLVLLHHVMMNHALFVSIGSELKKTTVPSRFIKCLSNKCTALFICAKSVLEDLCRNIIASTITLRELSLMECKVDDVNKLLSINTVDKEKVQNTLKEKFVERASFLKRIDRLKLLCWHVDIPVKGNISGP